MFLAARNLVRQQPSRQRRATELINSLLFLRQMSHFMALFEKRRMTGECLLPGVEPTCRSGGPRSQFDPKRT
jgi:hypothetical protein